MRTGPQQGAAHPHAGRRSLTRSTSTQAHHTPPPPSRFPHAPLPPAQNFLVARPQSHFLSQSYETILSTSLTVHSLYRPELVQLEDLLRFLVRRAPIQPRCVASHDVGFTGRGTPSPDAPQRVGPPALVRYEPGIAARLWRAAPALRPPLRTRRFRGRRRLSSLRFRALAVGQKRQLSPGGVPAWRGSVASLPSSSGRAWRDVDRLPFRGFGVVDFKKEKKEWFF